MTNLCNSAQTNVQPRPKVAYGQQGQYAHWLQHYNWDYFCTFTTGYELTMKSARRLMVRFKNIAERETSSELSIFWVCEKYEMKDGFHLHALMKVDPPKDGKRKGELFHQDPKTLFKGLIDSYQLAAGAKKDMHTGKWNTFHRVQFKKFNPKQKAGLYCTKYVMKEQGKRIEADYDLFI